MHIHFTIDDKQVANEFKEGLLDYLPSLHITEHYTDFENVPWDSYGTDPEDFGLDKNWIAKNLRELNKYYLETIDSCFFFVDRSNWNDNNTIGWHLHDTIGGARICQVKMNRDYEDIAWHEFMHAVYWYIYIHTGIKLDPIFGVKDYHDAIVHGNHPNFQEYKYEKSKKKIKPYLKEAIRRDSETEYKHLANFAITLLRRRKAQLEQILRNQV